MTEQSAIEISNLTRRFGDNTAVHELTLSVQSGEVFGFLGHNGAGKTTTIRLLNGVLQPDGGTMHILGFSPQADGPALRARTGVLTETPSLDERLTAFENLSIYADLYNVPPEQVKSRIDSMLENFELSDRAHDRVGGFSKGMKQRLALARAFLHKPELLFLDEPTSGLDPVSSRQVHEMIRRISQDEGHTVVLCTHNLTEAERLCHRVAVLEHGRVVAIGTPAELARQTGTGGRIEIEVQAGQVHQAQALLRDTTGIRILETNQERLTLVVEDRERIPELLAQFIGGGIRVYRVAPLEASLEDIYFALHDKQGTQVKEAAQ